MRGPSLLAGTVFGEFADLREACVTRGFLPDDLEVWQVAVQLGVHRPRRAEQPPADPFGAPTVTDPLIAEMKQAALARSRHGVKPEWSPPTVDEQAAIDRLMDLRR